MYEGASSLEYEVFNYLIFSSVVFLYLDESRGAWGHANTPLKRSLALTSCVRISCIDSLTLFGAVFDPTAAVESVDFTSSASVKSAEDSEKLGKAVAQGLLDKGAKEILDRVKGKVASEPNAKDARQEFWKEEK